MENNADMCAGEIPITNELIEEALALAALDAIESHRRAGLPLVTWRNGKVAYISPDEALGKKPAGKRRQPRARKPRRQS